MKAYCAVFSLMIFFFHCGEHQQIPEQPQEKAIETFDCGKLPGKRKALGIRLPEEPARTMASYCST